jgi:hypothetical protein
VPTPTYIPLATLTLTATDSEIVFSSIPATYRDLILIVGGSASAGQNIRGIFNGDTTATNYFRVTAYGEGSGSGTSGAANNNQFLYIQSGQSTMIAHVMDYSATDKHKSVLVRTSNSALAEMTAARWANTAAINSFTIQTTTGSFSVGSVFSLYGVN